jgi:hypothetical protein
VRNVVCDQHEAAVLRDSIEAPAIEAEAIGIVTAGARLIDERSALDGQRPRGIDRVDEPRFGEKARRACEMLREVPAYPADERL